MRPAVSRTPHIGVNTKRSSLVSLFCRSWSTSSQRSGLRLNMVLTVAGRKRQEQESTRLYSVYSDTCIGRTSWQAMSRRTIQGHIKCLCCSQHARAPRSSFSIPSVSRSLLPLPTGNYTRFLYTRSLINFDLITSFFSVSLFD
jgi:hypothetical protein